MKPVTESPESQAIRIVQIKQLLRELKRDLITQFELANPIENENCTILAEIAKTEVEEFWQDCQKDPRTALDLLTHVLRRLPVKGG